MGLIARYRRLRYVWGWRLKYWWLDTHAGRVAQLTCAGMTFVALIGVGVHIAILSARPPDPAKPHQAFVWVIFWVIMALTAAVMLLIGTPKAPKPQEQDAKAPTTQDGKSAVRYYGTNWIDQPAMLAWKVTGKDPIKTKGGKK